MTACASVWVKDRKHGVDFYSRMVALFKVLLPLAALAILATLFLLSRGIDLDGTIPFAESEVTERLRDQQITGPFFSGTTPKGDELIVNARLARPGGPGKPAEALDVSARLKTAEGVRMTMESDTVSVHAEHDKAIFAGNVRIVTSTGLELQTEQLNTALHEVAGETPGTVTGQAPFGDLEAGQMEFRAKNKSGPLHFLFKSGVKLVYRPAIKTEN